MRKWTTTLSITVVLLLGVSVVLWFVKSEDSERNERASKEPVLDADFSSEPAFSSVTASEPELRSAKKRGAIMEHEPWHLPTILEPKPEQQTTNTEDVFEEFASALQGKRYSEAESLFKSVEVLSDGQIRALARLLAPDADATAIYLLAYALHEQGTGAAITALLNATAQFPDGEVKEGLVKLLGSTEDAKLAQVFTERLLVEEDPSVMRACEEAIAGSANGAVVENLLQTYQNTDGVSQERIAYAISSIQNEAATDALVALLDTEPSVDEWDALSVAAMHGLASIGAPNATEALIVRIEAASPRHAIALAGAVKEIANPDAAGALRSAAAGNRDIQSVAARGAAINALVNYPGEDTVRFLEDIAREEQGTIFEQLAVEVLQRLGWEG